MGDGDDHLRDGGRGDEQGSGWRGSQAGGRDEEEGGDARGERMARRRHVVDGREELVGGGVSM